MSCTMPPVELGGPMQRRFDPYSASGGTSVAIAGKNFCVIGADTRQSDGYSINTRYAPKAFKLTDFAVFAFAGFYADGSILHKTILQRIQWYKHAHNKVMSIKSLAQLIQTILYGRRFFPYYTNVILAGVTPEGEGVVYNFDPVGNYEALTHDAVGTGNSLLQPLLDNQVGKYHQKNADTSLPDHDTAVKLVRDGFLSATERDIYTGDQLEIWTVDSQGVRVEQFDLKRD
ncbi:Proteasome subunit beta type-6 [Entomophthora muscae]|uniref:Proteasome subunit beta type-6 n=1 Tax=Entomophthora muscae TaxID=34485 RepID=A0ACC2SP13_9FUNG|nr:Proteasome subunit beta type-6 [Entomophthora muscae]